MIINCRLASCLSSEPIESLPRGVGLRPATGVAGTETDPQQGQRLGLTPWRCPKNLLPSTVAAARVQPAGAPVDHMTVKTDD